LVGGNRVNVPAELVVALELGITRFAGPGVRRKLGRQAFTLFREGLRENWPQKRCQHLLSFLPEPLKLGE
jgi:hypothetical protein